VYLNGKRVLPRFIAGKRLPVFDGSPFGPLSGEIVLITSSDSTVFGVEIKVKGVTINREAFGMTPLDLGNHYLAGEIHADFLPITSDRTNFIQDVPEYIAFQEAMDRIAVQIRQFARSQAVQREKRRGTRTLRQVLDHIAEALKKNEEFATWVGMAAEEAGVSSDVKAKREKRENAPPAKPKRRAPDQKRMVTQTITSSAVMRKLKAGRLGITCRIDHFGAGCPPAYSEGNIVYINRDHPLYLAAEKTRERLFAHIARLVTQEIVVMKTPPAVRKGFAIQNKLLTDALSAGKSEEANTSA